MQNSRIIFTENEKRGIMNIKGKIIYPADLYSINPFEYYYYTVGVLENYKKQGLINRDGKVVLPFIYDTIYYHGNLFSKIEKDGKWGLINYDGKIIISLIYDQIDRISAPEGSKEALFIVKDKNGEKLINSQNKIIIPNLQGGFSEVKQVFRNQKIVYQFSHILNKNEEDKAAFGIKSKNGKVIFVPQFEKISDFQNGFACAEPLQYTNYQDLSYLIDIHGNKLYLGSIDDQQRSIELQTCTDFEWRHDGWNSF